MTHRLPVFPVEGGCVCGAVRYRLTAPPLGVYACHCTDCRRYSGGAYSMSMRVHRKDVTLLSGALSEFPKIADSGRTVGVHFCPICATRIWHSPAYAPDFLNLKPGTLDDASWVKPGAHVWLASKLPSTPIDPDALQFERQPPTEGAAREAFLKAISVS